MQKYLFLPLDIFGKNQQNKGNRIENKLEAWLTFLSVDDPEIILRLIEKYPAFKPMYEDAYRLCLNIEEVMRMFSQELAELDRNTVQLMIDEMQEEINSQKRELKNRDEELSRMQAEKHEMIKKVYQSVNDTEKTAVLLGLSTVEVEAALAD